MITFRKLEHTITGTVNGRPFSVARTSDIEDFLLKAQSDPDVDYTVVMTELKAFRQQEIAGVNKYLVFNPVTKQYFLQLDGKRSKHAIPEVLVKYIEESYDKDIDYMPIVKAWARLLTNPRYNSTMADYFATYIDTTFVDMKEVDRLVEEDEIDRDIAIEMCTYQDIAITQEGLLATYKVAELVTWKFEMVLNEETGDYEKKLNKAYAPIPDKIDPTTGDLIEAGGFEKPDHLEDFQFTPAICKNGDKFFSGDTIGYVYEVGKMQYLPEDARRNLQNSFGGGGLYSGGLEYVDQYRGAGSHILTCFVDPADILSFQSSGHAFRTDALMPNNVWDETIPLKNVYHSSDYGKVSAARVDAIIAKAVEDGIDIAEEQGKNSGYDMGVDNDLDAE